MKSLELLKEYQVDLSTSFFMEVINEEDKISDKQELRFLRIIDENLDTVGVITTSITVVPEWVTKGFLKKIKSGFFEFYFLDKQGYKVKVLGINSISDREITNYSKILSEKLLDNKNLQEIYYFLDDLFLTKRNNIWRKKLKEFLGKTGQIFIDFPQETIMAVC